jgi:hypothetical protein
MCYMANVKYRITRKQWFIQVTEHFQNTRLKRLVMSLDEEISGKPSGKLTTWENEKEVVGY